VLIPSPVDGRLEGALTGRRSTAFDTVLAYVESP